MLRSLLYVVLVAAPLAAQSAEEKQATLKFLHSLALADGGYMPAPQDPSVDAAPRSSLRATSAAIRSIRYLGGEIPNPEQTRKYVLSCRSEESGAFADQPGGMPDVTMTAVGMMALAELDREAKFEKSIAFLVKNARTFEERRLAVAGMEAARKFDPVIADWFKEIDAGKNADGTFGRGQGQARDTGGIAAMMLRSGTKIEGERRTAIVKALKQGQFWDGGFGKESSRVSDPETTYRVMRAFHLLGEQPGDPEKLRSYLKSLRNPDGGYTTEAGKPSSVSGTYFAVTVLKWLASGK